LAAVPPPAARFFAAGLRAAGFFSAAGLAPVASPSPSAFAAAGLRAGARAPALIEVTSIRVRSCRWPVRRL